MKDSSIDDNVIKCKDCGSCPYFMPCGDRGRIACLKAHEAYMKVLASKKCGDCNK